MNRKVTAPIQAEKKLNLLEQLCGNDVALYEDLSCSMYLRPNGKGTYADAIEKAEVLENERKESAAAYRHAGALALYEGNAKGVRAAFDKHAELSGRKYLRMREVPEKAVEVVRGYYAKELA
jgi:hypothetical protein